MLIWNKLEGMNLCSIGINNPVFINDGLCSCYKMLWRKCKELWFSKYIHAFWVSNDTLRLSLTESGHVHFGRFSDKFCRSINTFFQVALYFLLLILTVDSYILLFMRLCLSAQECAHPMGKLWLVLVVVKLECLLISF